MKALTLTQPWATLVMDGRKQYETRSWPSRYQGPLAIHAAKGMPEYARQAAIDFGYDPDALPRGVVLGTVQMLECEAAHVVRKRLYTLPHDEPEEIDFGDFSDGRWCFMLDCPERFAAPIPARGALGLWDWREEA